jgi:hypothetical protein
MQTSLLHELVVGTPIIYDQFQKSVNRYLLDSASHQCQYPSKHQSKSKTFFSFTDKSQTSKLISLSIDDSFTNIECFTVSGIANLNKKKHGRKPDSLSRRVQEHGEYFCKAYILALLLSLVELI